MPVTVRLPNPRVSKPPALPPRPPFPPPRPPLLIFTEQLTDAILGRSLSSSPPPRSFSGPGQPNNLERQSDNALMSSPCLDTLPNAHSTASLSDQPAEDFESGSDDSDCESGYDSSDLSDEDDSVYGCYGDNLEKVVLSAVGDDLGLAAFLIHLLHQDLSAARRKVENWTYMYTAAPQGSPENTPAGETPTEQDADRDQDTSRKRKRNTSDEEGDGEHEELPEDNGDHEDEDPDDMDNKAQSDPQTNAGVMLACPFNKKDPFRYGGGGYVKDKRDRSTRSAQALGSPQFIDSSMISFQPFC